MSDMSQNETENSLNNDALLDQMYQQASSIAVQERRSATTTRRIFETQQLRQRLAMATQQAEQLVQDLKQSAACAAEAARRCEATTREMQNSASQHKEALSNVQRETSRILERAQAAESALRLAVEKIEDGKHSVARQIVENWMLFAAMLLAVFLSTWFLTWRKIEPIADEVRAVHELIQPQQEVQTKSPVGRRQRAGTSR